MGADVVMTVLTLNCWGLAFFSSDRSERISAIGKALRSGKYDIICLQELWIENDYDRIRNAVKEILPYSHYFYSGVTGSGLCIISRWPFEAIMFHQWSLNGYIHKIFHGDWFGGKGIGLCRIITQGFHINIYTTHLHAQYNMNDDEYLAHRVTQAFDTAQFIRLTSEGAHFSVLAGDLNTQPGELCHQLIQHTAQLSDAYEAHTDESETGTYGCIRNSYATKSYLANPNGERIDHILYKTGLGAQVELESYKMPLEDRVPDCNFSYSDHEAIAATFRLSLPPGGTSVTTLKGKEDMKNALTEGVNVVVEAQRQIYWDKMKYWSIVGTLVIGLVTLVIFSDIPKSYPHSFQICLVIITGIFIFASIMATIWNQIELHGLLRTQLTMEILLERMSVAKPQESGDAPFDTDSILSQQLIT